MWSRRNALRSQIVGLSAAWMRVATAERPDSVIPDQLATITMSGPAILAKLHTRPIVQAMWIWVVHDLDPRALGPKVRGYVEAQSWFQDLTPVSVG